VLSRFHNLLTYIYLSRLVCYPHWNGRKSCAICERSAEESLTTSPEEDDASSPEGEGGAYKPGETIADAEDIKLDSDIQASIQTLMEKIIPATISSSTDDLLLVQRTREEDQLHVVPSHSVSPPSPVTSTISSPPTPPNSENVEEAAASSTDDYQAEVILSSSTIDEHIGGTSKNDEPIGHISEEEEEEQRVDDTTTKASKNDSTNDDNKKRRRKRKVNTPLESICCRGVCGGNASCLSQETSSDTAQDGNVRFLRCLNFETDLKCPLWIGHSCATQFNNFKCRICALLDNPHRDFAR
jgi:hypothetical protein